MAKNINFVTLAGLVVDKKDYLCNTLAIKFMKKFISFFGGPLVGGILALIGILEYVLKIPASFLDIEISLWLILLIAGVVIIFTYIYRRLRILYFLKRYTSGSFGGSRLYRWNWVKTSKNMNVFGYMPDNIEVIAPTRLDPNIPVYDCRHSITNIDLLREYIMISLYCMVENTKQSNEFLRHLHTLEEHFSNFRQ